MTGHTAFGLHRGMFISKRTLLIRVAFNASSIAAGGQSRLFEFKAAMRVMTVTATHRPFHDLMMERHGKRGFDLAMATQAKLRVAHFQHFDCREARLFGIYRGYPCDRAGQVLIGCDHVWRVAISAADVVAPVLAAAEVIMLFLTSVARQTGLSSFFRRFILKGNDLSCVALGDVVLARAMAGFATSHFPLPTANRRKLGMRSVRVSLELIFVAVLASVAADVVIIHGFSALGRVGVRGGNGFR